MCNMQELHLYDNNIGDPGLAALVGALGKGALASCKKLDLAYNRIRDAGLSAFAEAVGKGALPKCTYINLGGNPGSSAPVEKALREREK